MLLSFAYLDQIIDETLAAQPANAALTEEVVRGGVIAVSVIVLVVTVGLSVLFAIFLGKGKNWSRMVLTILAAISLLGGLVGLAGVGREQPIALQVIRVVSLLLAAALIYFLWKKDSSRWLTAKG